MGVNHSVITGKVVKLREHGFIGTPIRSTSNIYPILPKGNEVLRLLYSMSNKPDNSDFRVVSDIVSSWQSFPNRIRLHRLIIKYELKNYLPHDIANKFASFSDQQIKIMELKNHRDVFIGDGQDFNVLITRSHLIISGIQAYLSTDRSIEEQVIGVLSSLQDAVIKVERQLQRMEPLLKLKRVDRGVLVGEIQSIELAYEGHPISEIFIAKRGVLNVTDIHDGKQRITADKSNGSYELETTHNGFALQDMEMLRRNTEFLAKNDIEKILKDMKENR